jgi:WhiB family redox-sensing transcriptional regulator
MSTPKAGDTSWRMNAACTGKNPELWFPERSNSLIAQQAKKECAACPVRATCLAWAIETEVEFGVWGGTTEADRRRMGIRAPRKSIGHELKPCGTQAAYDRHVKRSEPIDDECREANRVRQAERRKAKKEAKAAAAAELALAS